MRFCMQCGHELGASRTCSSCGTTAPVEPPPALQLPPAGVRYPLFADEVDSVNVSTSGRVLAAPVDEPIGASVAAKVQPPSGGPPSGGPPAGPPAGPPPGARPEPSILPTAGIEDDELTQVRLPAVPVMPRRGVPAALWVVLAGLVALALVLGVWLLLRGQPSEPGRSESTASTAGSPSEERDLADTATASAPVTRAPGVDTQGNKTSYDASNMLDGDPATAWEMPGDGTGKVLTFTLANETRLAQVGLINGYAKTGEQGGQKVNWYAGNRRVLAVEWLFDDGTVVRQDLSQTTAMQTTDVDVRTKTVRLRLLTVSAPGTGRAARNMTPVSEVQLRGTPG